MITSPASLVCILVKWWCGWSSSVWTSSAGRHAEGGWKRNKREHTRCKWEMRSARVDRLRMTATGQRRRSWEFGPLPRSRPPAIVSRTHCTSHSALNCQAQPLSVVTQGSAPYSSWHSAFPSGSGLPSTLNNRKSKTHHLSRALPHPSHYLSNQCTISLWPRSQLSSPTWRPRVCSSTSLSSLCTIPWKLNLPDHSRLVRLDTIPVISRSTTPSLALHSIRLPFLSPSCHSPPSILCCCRISDGRGWNKRIK